jgi:hypothetical protein
MEAFIKIVEEKKEPVDDVNLHTQIIERLKSLLSEGKNVFITGATGVGKTYVVNHLMRHGGCVELLPEHVKSKNNFLDLIRNSDKHLVLDDYDSEFKTLVERVSGGERLTRTGSLVVTSNKMFMLPNFANIIIPPHPPDRLALLTPTKFSMDAAVKSRGNIRNFLNYNDGFDIQDLFLSPKEIIHDLLSNVESQYNLDYVHEHGHMWDVFSNNYLDSPGVNMPRLSDSFSEADLFDSVMYHDGSWELMPYFVNSALVIPKHHMGMPLKREKIKPGSSWTKHGNMRMRAQKIKDISNSSGVYPVRLSNDELCLLQKYAARKNIDPLISYKIAPQSFDVMNHLCLMSKLKPRDVSHVKKKLKDAGT